MSLVFAGCSGEVFDIDFSEVADTHVEGDECLVDVLRIILLKNSRGKMRLEYSCHATAASTRETPSAIDVDARSQQNQRGSSA